jgi:hypothetical protein
MADEAKTPEPDPWDALMGDPLWKDVIEPLEQQDVIYYRNLTEKQMTKLEVFRAMDEHELAEEAALQVIQGLSAVAAISTRWDGRLIKKLQKEITDLKKERVPDPSTDNLDDVHKAFADALLENKALKAERDFEQARANSAESRAALAVDTLEAMKDAVRDLAKVIK